MEINGKQKPHHFGTLFNRVQNRLEVNKYFL